MEVRKVNALNNILSLVEIGMCVISLSVVDKFLKLIFTNQR